MDDAQDEEVLNQLPPALRMLATWERFHLHRTEHFYGGSGLDPKYLPYNCGAFRLPCFWIFRKHLFVYGRQLDAPHELRLFADNGGLEKVLFPVHPTCLARLQPFLSAVRAEDAAADGLCIWAVPTSSVRTLLAWPHQHAHQAVFFKLSLDDMLMGDRHLYRRNVARSVGLSSLAQQSAPRLPDAMGFLPESVSFIPRKLLSSGVIVRSIPPEVKAGRIVLAPLFSLIGGVGQRRPVFLTIVERHPSEARMLLEEVICAQFARVWLELTLRFGLLLECHAQDLMLALSSDLAPLGRFFYRDFDGCQVDWELRKARGLNGPPGLPGAEAWLDTYTVAGYHLGNLISQIMRRSLYSYLSLWLDELESAMREWHRVGWLDGPQVQRDSISEIFSRTMRTALHDLFGISTDVYNIYHSPNRFMKLLFNLRRELLDTPGSGAR